MQMTKRRAGRRRNYESWTGENVEQPLSFGTAVVDVW